MRILIVTPIVEGAITGNIRSADSWAEVLEALGHEVEVAACFESQDADLLVALHAVKSRASIEAFRASRPEGRIVLILTGTDIYPAPDTVALASMKDADRLVALQHKACSQVPREMMRKVSVIVQSAGRPAGEVAGDPDHFDVAVVANLRDVKDPLAAAAAARLLPDESKLRIRHAGAVLDGEYEILARREIDENPRYTWLGPVDPEGALQLIASSDLLVVSSLSEGAGRVVGEAAVAGTPVVSTRIDGVVGLLGDDYPGYYPVGDNGALASLLHRAETDPAFLQSLTVACEAKAPQFSAETEQEAWRDLIAGIAL